VIIPMILLTTEIVTSTSSICTLYYSILFGMWTMWTRVHVHPIMKNFKNKKLFQSSRKIWKNARMYILCWHLLVLILTMYDLHINVKIEIPIFVNSTKPIIIISFSCRPHTIVFFRENLHKHQHNMYIKNILTFWGFSNSIFFNIGEYGCTRTHVHPGIFHLILRYDRRIAI
jgi:hypothetical protein